MESLDSIHDFVVRRDDLRTVRVRERAAEPMGVGDVVLSIDRFALTANNITYASFGDAMSYWDFFPSGEHGWGRVPVWGFGTVVASACDGVAVGERFYGFYPMSTHLSVQPVRVGATGFVDGAAHRAALHPLYNQYTRVATDALYDVAHEGLQLLLRPLFITSFVIDDLLADQGFFDARAVVVSSASSKTAWGLAWQLSRRRPDAPEIVALTSPRNAAFVEGLGCYDRVVTYDALASLAPDRAIYVDFAGDRTLRADVHRHFGAALVSSIVVGASHHGATTPVDGEPLPGARPTFFFAPAQIRKRVAEWGADGFQQRFADAWHALIARVADARRPWLSVVAANGPDAVARVYRELLDGRTRPDEGWIASLHANGSATSAEADTAAAPTR